MDQSPSTRLISTEDAATYCASAASTLEKYRLRGKGPTYIKLGRRVAYDRADLDAWIASNRRNSTSEG